MDGSKEIDKVIEHARMLATVAHHGQFRRDGVTPYITHPEAVAAAVQDELKPAAWLHDVAEDTWLTFPLIHRVGLPPDVVDQVYFLTRYDKMDYRDYIHQICKNRNLARIKLADMRHNLSCQPSQKSIEKSEWVLPMLEAAVNL